MNLIFIGKWHKTRKQKAIAPHLMFGFSGSFSIFAGLIFF
jgi:hypothetical protein